MTDYEKKFENTFENLNVKERLNFLCELRAQEKAIESFRKSKSDWVLEQSDSVLKACGVFYRVVPRIKRISEKKLKEQDPQLYFEVLAKFGYVQKERIDLIFKGVKK